MTMRYAMVDILRKPPAELAEVVRHHFRMRKSTVEDVCSKWAAKSHSGEYKTELATVMEELKKL